MSQVKKSEQMQRPSFAEIKRELTAKTGWLSEFRDFNKPLDRAIYDALEPIYRKQLSDQEDPINKFIGATNSMLKIYKYRPTLVEDNLADAAALLDRCEGYRERLYELEIKAVSSELSWKGSLDSYENGMNLAAIVDRHADLKKSSVDLEGAARRYEETNMPGHRLEALSKSHLDESASRREEKQRQAVEESLREQLEIQKKLAACRMDSGGFNYAERYNTIRRYLLEDVKEAYQKVRSASGGLSLLFGDQISESLVRLLKPTEEKFLEAMVSWVRSCMRELDVLYESETERDEAYSILLGNTVAREKLERDFKNNSRAGLTVKVAKKDFEAPGVRRLRGVGLSYLWDTDMKVQYPITVKVIPPSTLAGNGLTFPIDQLGALSGVSFSIGAPTYNISPYGQWTVWFEEAFIDPPLMSKFFGQAEVLLHIKSRALYGSLSERYKDPA